MKDHWIETGNCPNGSVTPSSIQAPERNEVEHHQKVSVFAAAPGRSTTRRARRLFSGDCRFLLSAPTVDCLPPADRPEVCFTGRSNVGKSSIINALTHQRRLARISNTPGRTREINLFAVGNAHHLADLPGYGFARMSKSVAARSALSINDYIMQRASLRRVFLLIDARRGPMDIDDSFMHFLDEAGVNFQIVVTKLDKLRAPQQMQLEDTIRTSLATHPASFPQAIGTSAVTKKGIDTLRCQIAAIR